MWTFRSHHYIDILNWSLSAGLLHHLCVASSMVVVMVGCKDLRKGINTHQATYHNSDQSNFHQNSSSLKCKQTECWTTNRFAVETLTATISTFSSLALAKTKCASHPVHVTLMGWNVWTAKRINGIFWYSWILGQNVRSSMQNRGVGCFSSAFTKLNWPPLGQHKLQSSSRHLSRDISGAKCSWVQQRQSQLRVLK